MKKRVLSLIIAVAMILGTMGTVVFAEEQTGVAKIGETEYATFGEAMTAAKSENGAVEVELYDKVTLNQSLDGSYGTIKFIGKDTDAEIYLDVQGYITASGKTVAFENLKLSKSSGSFITNAGFMNVAFGVYDVNSVSYKDCVFSNGAYASSGKTTFTNCTFYKSHDKYGLWAYGNVDCTVDGCTFADYRGIKMYAEGAAKTVDLTVKNTNFTAVDNKPAIVLTYGESVTLENNTYSSTGVFELDLDGAPNGTSVTADVAPTCKNDNGACGVLVDGKIYTTVTDAVAVAESGDTVTLLYDTEEDVTFAEGVIFDSNGNTAPNVKIEGNTSTLPEAKLEKLAPMVLTSDDGYMAWPSGDSSIDRPLNVVVKFSAIDTEETVETSPYKGWYTDYYITFDGLKDDSFVADGCYLAGNYGSYGWIVIPVDELEIEEGVVYPVVSSYDAQLTYKEICTNVKEMICAIYIKPEIIEANPDMTVTLNLGIKNGDEGEVVYVNSSVYDADELAGYVAKVGDEKYTSLADAVAAADGKTVTLLADTTLTGTITVPEGKIITLDLNGKTISGTDNATGSYGLINIQPGAELTINDTVGTGKITLTSTTNRGWNAYSSVISNQRGKLIVNSGIIEHLGGTDMAYGIDNLTNGKGTYAETIINGGTIKSTYRAIRQFLNGVEAQNILTVNGGNIVGANKSIWMQDPSKNANTGKLTVAEGATLNGDVYLFVTAGSTEWPVEVSIDADALAEDSTVVTGNIPAGYVVEETNGTWGVEREYTITLSADGGKYADGTSAIAFNASYEQWNETEVISFGMYIFKQSDNMGTRITVDTNDGADLKAANGLFNAVVTAIPAGNCNDFIVCLPYVIVDGNTIAGEVKAVTASQFSKILAGQQN